MKARRSISNFPKQCCELALEKMYSSEEKRMIVHVESPELNLHVRLALRATGGRVLVGKAPPGALERLVQEFIDDQ